MTNSAFAGRGRVRLAALALSTILCSGFAAPAFAQSLAPVRQSIDGNGVDLFLGTLNINTPSVSMGSAGESLGFRMRWRGGWNVPYYMPLTKSGSLITVGYGDKSDSFTQSGTTYTSNEGDGATLTYDGSSTYTYTQADGTLITYSKSVVADNGVEAYATSIAKPSGKILTFNYVTATYCSSSKEGGDGQICLTHATTSHLSTVTSNFGYAVTISYQADSLDPDESPPELLAWHTVVGGSVANLAVAGSSGGSLTTTYSSSGGNTYLTVTDAMLRDTAYRFTLGQLLGIKKPGSSSEDVTVAYTSGRVSSVTTAAGTVTYSAPSDSSGIRTLTVTDPASHVTTYTFDIASQRMKSVTDATSHTTSFDYDTSGRLTKTTLPEGNYTQLTYDARGNVKEGRKVAKSGSGVSDIVTSANFVSSCTNPATCNEPTYTIDALGNQTDYAYDSSTGLITSITAPAPTIGATRPQTRYSYTSYQAYYDPALGTSYAASGYPVTRLTGVSQCQTGSSCTGTSDEVKTTTSYGPQTSGVGNNLLPVSVSTGTGDGSLTATTTMAYDATGNLISVDGPLSGSDDTTTYRYDADREGVGVISPDPDGAGSLKRRAVRLTYDAHGLVTDTEAGTVNGTTDTDWAGFTALQKTTAGYDGADRKVTSVLSASGTNYAVMQYDYDTAGRPDCVAVRMNSATWGSLPSSACTLGTTGSYGPDRITKTSYDAANRPTLVQTAYGTSDQADEATGTYNSNGTLATLTDAQGNTTTYEYDGADRLSKTRYPVTTAGSGTSSTTDYEQLTYDAGSEVTNRRLRDGNSIGYAYDHLGRLTGKDLPGSELDVAYSYDLLGRPLSAATSVQTLTFSYDALSRSLTQGGPLGTVSSQYDLAGRRTRLTWPDSFYISYDYLLTGEMSAARENGATSGIGVLATFTYDDLGRRTSLTRGNGTSSSYGYDTVSRLTSLGLDQAGTSYDQSLGFSYSPAGQIAATTRSNDTYAWTAAADRNDASAVNGLNQVTGVGAGSIGYDSKGNLSSSGSNSYTYSSENLLLTGPSSAALIYDPLTRLYQESGTSITTARFQYEGQEIIGEYDTGGTLQKRYVRGPGADEALVEYDKSGGSYIRAWLHADERGSIVARSDDSGATTAVNSYDEYGVPASGNTGRLGYTGQAWLPSLGIWDYKARMYSSRLGRFMQTDPIGYGDGANWYNYVGSDPVNGLDSGGLKASGSMSLCSNPGDNCYTIQVGDDWSKGGTQDKDGDNGGIDSPGKVYAVFAPPKYDGPDIQVFGQRLQHIDSVSDIFQSLVFSFGAPGVDGPPIADEGAKSNIKQNDNHGCAAGTVYKARDTNGAPICQTPPRFTPPANRPKGHLWITLCSWAGDATGALVGGAAATAVTAVAIETGPAAPVIGGTVGFVVGGGVARSFNRAICH